MNTFGHILETPYLIEYLHQILCREESKSSFPQNLKFHSNNSSSKFLILPMNELILYSALLCQIEILSSSWNQMVGRLGGALTNVWKTDIIFSHSQYQCYEELYRAKMPIGRAGENVRTNCISIVIHHREAMQCSAPIPANQSHLSHRNEENGVTNDADCL